MSFVNCSTISLPVMRVLYHGPTEPVYTGLAGGFPKVYNCVVNAPKEGDGK